MRKQALTLLAVFGLHMCGLAPLVAGEADVLAAEATNDGNGVWSFSVTVKHADEGWEHYSNRFEVVGHDGKVLGVRTLLHPHETEQPFTRAQSGIVVPEGMSRVLVRAKCSVDGWAGKTVVHDLP